MICIIHTSCTDHHISPHPMQSRTKVKEMEATRQGVATQTARARQYLRSISGGDDHDSTGIAQRFRSPPGPCEVFECQYRRLRGSSQKAESSRLVYSIRKNHTLNRSNLRWWIPPQLALVMLVWNVYLGRRSQMVSVGTELCWYHGPNYTCTSPVNVTDCLLVDSCTPVYLGVSSLTHMASTNCEMLLRRSTALTRLDISLRVDIAGCLSFIHWVDTPYLNRMLLP